MATRAPKAAVAMCLVQIGYESYVMPTATGLRVVELMKDAQLVDPMYSSGGTRYYKQDQSVRLTLEIIKDRQVLPGPRPDSEQDET